MKSNENCCRVADLSKSQFTGSFLVVFVVEFGCLMQNTFLVLVLAGTLILHHEYRFI